MPSKISALPKALLLSALVAIIAPRAEAAKYRIRWVLAHEPAGVFEQAAKEFSRLISAETKGEIEVRIISAKEFGHDRVVAPDEVAREVASGAIEMTQTYTTTLSRRSENLLVLELPYLFRSHGHAAKVLDGAIGRELLASLEPLNMKGLAFTYSGGYRILPTTAREIRSPQDLKGLRVRTENTPVEAAIFRTLGAEPVPAGFDDTVALAKAGKIDAGETTLPRFADGHQEEGLPVINETRHTLFLTAVLINQKFYDSLPKGDQDAISRAALRMARTERKRSIDEGEAVKRNAIAKGEKFISLTPKERARFAAALQPVYAEFAPRFGNMVKRIQETR
ncbi:MAG: TRAP transporter substrate-binding protein [Elusimicrobia bacterium]|nr:TRAP transporter substrate-binding protein [Elusimicrobiota bacterium]